MATLRCAPIVHIGRADDLDVVLGADCALAIWRHDACPVLTDMLTRLDVASVDDLDEVLPSGEAALSAVVMLGAAGYGCSLALVLAREIGALVDRLSAITGCRQVRVRLEVVETDACRRFHADVVTVRMIRTLRGPGTQWIESAKPDMIEQILTGAVAIFKGRLLMPEPPVLHRSPPIAGTGVQRLVLVIDPVRDDGPSSLAAPVT